MKSKRVYVCTECDYQSPSWLGKCPSCGAWNTFEEETYTQPSPAKTGGSASVYKYTREPSTAAPFSAADDAPVKRMSTGIGELDRVLGGGLVNGSVVLLAGEPGIGKSTILLQLCSSLEDGKRILYVSGEESRGQLKMRADRLEAHSDRLFVLTDTDIETVIHEKERISPDVMIIDSIQTITASSASASAGSVSQVKECAAALIACAKTSGTAIIIVGHVNKEGSIAGPKVLEHMVDAVLYFEGERSQSHRIIRAAKNRFGSTNEIGVFEMRENGLVEIENPSAMLLSGRPENVSGSCAVCVMEGSRPIIAEVQALVIPSSSPSPRRTADGIDYNRMYLLLAVLEKRLGFRFSSCDVYLNVVGGLRLDEPAADAAVAAAMISSIRDIPLPNGIIISGEVGLAGEVRAVPSVSQRVSEAARLGFDTVVIPKQSAKREKISADGIRVMGMDSVFDMLKLFKKGE